MLIHFDRSRAARSLRGCKSALAALVLCLTLQTAFAQTHPRLLFGPEDIPGLRARVQEEPYKTMVDVLILDAESGQYGIYDGPTPEFPERPTDPYGECVNAMRLGFLYVLTGDDGYAERARFYVDRRISDQSVHRWGYSGQKGLNLYFNGKSVAMVYDWCFGAPSWDAAFAETVSAALLEQGNVISDSGGTEQNTNAASNWQGLRGSSAVLCFLACDESYASSRYDSMYSKTRNYLRENLGTEPDSRGWNIEGIGYLGYPYATVIPALLAARRDDPARDMASGLPAMDYALWTQYAATVRFHRGEEVWLLHPDFGDDNATADDANGMYGFAFLFSKPSLVPGLKYWYDRLLVPEDNWDFSRAGTIFSILHYPADVESVPPLQIHDWRAGFLDTSGNGYYTYRNQYQNTDDMVAQLYVKQRGNKGHSGPDALSFRILGLNTAWAVGGGRYGPKLNGQDAYWRSQNTVYPVDPDDKLSINGNSGHIVGTPSVDLAGGGQVVSAIGRNNVGTSAHKRWFAADYSKDAGVDAVYVIADESVDGLFWQYNTLDENSISVGDDWFMIHGQDGATLKGTVLYPDQGVEFVTGNRIRGSLFAYGTYGPSNNFVHFRGAGDYLVVLTVAREGQTHPVVTRQAGRVRGATVDVGGTTFGIAADAVLFGEGPGSVPAAPGAVSSLRAVASADFAEATLDWDPVAEASGYVIERSLDGETFSPLTKVIGATTVTDNDLTPGAAYDYRVTAFNDGGDAAASPVARVHVASSLNSELIALESFEAYDAGPLAGRNGPGGWSGSWGSSSATVVDVAADPLAANGITGGGRALRLPYGEDVGRRLFASPVAGNDYGSGVWISYLLRWESGSVSSEDSAWVFNSVGNRDWAFVGLTANGSFTASDYYKSGTSSATVMEPGETAQVVARVTQSSVALWINPASASEAALVTKSLSNSKGWLAGFPGIGLCARTNDSFLIDRLVVARSFEAVMQDPAPPRAFDGWISQFVSLSAEERDAAADPDGDHVPNIAEYWHGTDPTARNPRLVQLRQLSANTVALEFEEQRNTSGCRVRYQRSSTLAADGWTDVIPVTEEREAGSATDHVRVIFPRGDEDAVFFRMLYEPL